MSTLQCMDGYDTGAHQLENLPTLLNLASHRHGNCMKSEVDIKGFTFLWQRRLNKIFLLLVGNWKDNFLKTF